MTKQDAVNFFGSTAKLAKALGITPDAVNKWAADVPKKRMHALLAAMKAENALRAKELDLREKLAAVRG
jgi:DNA-binding transcriptional regulator YdaS (Cro superfamily)